MTDPLKIICVGKIKEPFFKDGISFYLRKLSSRCRVEIVECPDQPTPDKASQKEEEKIRQIEGDRILQKITRDDRVIALCIEGRQLSTEQLTRLLRPEFQKVHDRAQGSLCIVIGGSLGLSPAVISRANLHLSFSAMTFPHQMMRLILLEQLDRCIK